MRTWMQMMVVAGALACAGGQTRSLADNEDAVAFASSFVESDLKPFLASLDSLKVELKKANADRAGWADYSADWKSWTPAAAEQHNPSYGYAEYLWSGRKDRSFRLRHMTGPIADALRAFQKNSHGRVAELFITDAKGGNVVQSQPTTDWFQGDEAKFLDVSNSHQTAFGEPKRDDTVGKVGVHTSVPIFDDDGALLGVAIALVVSGD